jgi:DNA-binding response OmpR family regulator
MNKDKTTKILLVDDEPNILVALEFLFKKDGYLVEKAQNGHQALEKARTFCPHIMVLDVMMPGLDGFEVARRLRNMPDAEEVRIIFLTAKGTTNDRMKGYSSGGEIYLTKPFDNEELMRTVREIVEFG